MTTQRLPHALIDPNPDQPRKIFDAEKLGELADSILENGLAQPITVRPTAGGDRYEIIMGERRWRAHGLLIQRGHEQFATIEAHVKSMDDLTRDIQAILENLQREDVTPLEEARAFRRLIETGVAIEDLAKRVGRPVWRLQERLQLLKLDASLLTLVEGGGLDVKAAHEIAKLATHADQIAITRLWNKGALVGIAALKAAVHAKRWGITQADMFGDAPKATDEEVETLRGMEAKIERMASLAAAGWKDGECVVAVKVDRGRAQRMAEQIAAMQGALRIMEKQLRVAGAQAGLSDVDGSGDLLAIAS